MHRRLLRGGPPQPDEYDDPVEVGELEQHPLLTRLLKSETQICGLSPGNSTAISLLAALLPVLFTLVLTVYGTHYRGAFDGCTDASGIPQPLATCFTCNGNTTVVEVRRQPRCCPLLSLHRPARARDVTRGAQGGSLDEEVTDLLLVIAMWPITAFVLEVGLIRGFTSRVRAVRLLEHGVWVQTKAGSCVNVIVLIIAAASLVTFNASSLFGVRSIGDRLRLGDRFGECYPPIPLYETFTPTFNANNPTRPDAGATAAMRAARVPLAPPAAPLTPVARCRRRLAYHADDPGRQPVPVLRTPIFDGLLVAGPAAVPARPRHPPPARRRQSAGQACSLLGQGGGRFSRVPRTRARPVGGRDSAEAQGVRRHVATAPPAVSGPVVPAVRDGAAQVR